MVRMTNTYITAGHDDPEAIIADTDSGVYVAQLGGGQVNTATGDFVFGMTEAYLIENGEITDPIREGNLIGNGPEVLTASTGSATTAMGSPGTCGKDGQVFRSATAPRRFGSRRSPSAVRPPDRCRNSLTSPPRVAGWANDGEQVEAFVVHETETEVRAYEGEVESFTRAESQGVGVRVIVDGKQGYAYAGTLDDTALQETLREARDNASFAEPDEFNGLAVPDGVEPASLELWSDTVGRSRPRTRSPWRSSSSGRRSQPKPGSRVSSRPNTSTLRTSRRLPPRRVSPLRPERPVATSPCTRSPKPTARPRPVSGSRSAATRVNLTRPSPPPMPPTGPLGFLGRRSRERTAHRRVRPVGDRSIPRHRRSHPHR